MDEASVETSSLPFSVKPGEVLSRENIENVTRELGPDFVIKTPTEKSMAAGRASAEYLKQTRDDYLLLERYVPGFVPETFFVRAANEKGEPTNYVVQRRLKGEMKPLHKVSDKEINDPEVASQLLEFVKGVKKMDEATGKIPDMFGRPLHPLSPRFYNPRYANNICLVENEFGGKRIFLTDMGAITEHAEKKDVHHKASMGMVRKNLRKFERDLKRVITKASEVG